MDARHGRGRWWLAAGAMMVVATSAVGCTPMAGSATTPVAGSSPTSTTAGLSPTTATATDGLCSATGLEFTGEQSHGGSGTAATVFGVRNRGSNQCRLSGVPTLRAVAAPGGVPAPVPVQAGGTGQPVTLGSGGSASLMVTYVNGYGGYARNDPHCQHPVTYSRIAVVLDDGSALDLGDFQLEILCGAIVESPWTAAQ
jgi:hypothetical protein